MIKNITINTHSSIRIEGRQVIYFDPFKIENESHDADAIFITHDHFDHFDPGSIVKVMRDDTLLVMPRSSLRVWSESGLISSQMVQMDPGQSIDIFGFLIETIPAYNIIKSFHPRKKNWLGYVVTFEGRRIYVAGDTDLTPESKQVKCDIAFVPAGGKFTMNALKAAELVNIIHPEIAVPTHYGDIVGKPGDGRTFKSAVRDDIVVPLLIRHKKDTEPAKVRTAPPAAEAAEEAPADAAPETIAEAPAADAAAEAPAAEAVAEAPMESAPAALTAEVTAEAPAAEEPVEVFAADTAAEAFEEAPAAEAAEEEAIEFADEWAEPTSEWAEEPAAEEPVDWAEPTAEYPAEEPTEELPAPEGAEGYEPAAEEPAAEWDPEIPDSVTMEKHGYEGGVVYPHQFGVKVSDQFPHRIALDIGLTEIAIRPQDLAAEISVVTLQLLVSIKEGLQGLIVYDAVIIHEPDIVIAHLIG